MASERERILVVEHDPIVGDLIARQALGGQGYEVKVVEEVSSAIKAITAFAPDVVIANLDLPGLSGKDLMAALAFQNMQIPVIMTAAHGQEKDVIQAFRLGASDYISMPLREAEIVSAVERALQSVRARKERQNLAYQLQYSNNELKRRVSQLTTLFSIGKSVTSATDQNRLFDQITEGAVKITQADYAWLLILDERSHEFILRSQMNLPKSLLANMNKPWDDGISLLVARSGESFLINGDPLKRFMLYSLGKAAMVVPVKVHNQAIGLLVVMRKANEPFHGGDQAMAEAVADYAAISLVNARLFRALDERAASLQTSSEKLKENDEFKDQVIYNISNELQTPLVAAKGNIDLLLQKESVRLAPHQIEYLRETQKKLDEMVRIIQTVNLLYEASTPRQIVKLEMNELVKQVVNRFNPAAMRARLQLIAELPQEPIYAAGDAQQISLVLDALVSNAIKFSHQSGQVMIKLARTSEGMAYVSVADQGIGISKRHLDFIFDRFYQVDVTPTRKYSGLGIGLTLVKEIVEAHGGRVGVESKLEVGSTFYFTLPGWGEF